MVCASNLSGSRALPFEFAIARSAKPFLVDMSVRQVTDCVVDGSSSQVRITRSGRGVGSFAFILEYSSGAQSSWAKPKLEKRRMISRYA